MRSSRIPCPYFNHSFYLNRFYLNRSNRFNHYNHYSHISNKHNSGANPLLCTNNHYQQSNGNTKA